jgi:hypothetical protein
MILGEAMSRSDTIAPRWILNVSPSLSGRDRQENGRDRRSSLGAVDVSGQETTVVV